MIRVTVPIDDAIVETTGSAAFALATPLRADQLVALAVEEALGARAPQDKRERTLRTVLAGFSAGDFILDIDGRLFAKPSEVVVCAKSATLRFFSVRKPAALASGGSTPIPRTSRWAKRNPRA
jgi:hypothetical protein